MDGASNNWIARRSIDIIQSIRPRTLVIQWSYIERREQPNKYLNQAWNQFYASIRDPKWPKELKLENFSTLPQHIQDEILTGNDQGWRCGLSDEQLRLPYIKSTDEEDIENTINCIESVNQTAGSTKVIHSFIPQFVNKSCKQLFDSQLTKTSNRLIIPEFKPVDLARDGHHYDIATASNLATLIIKLGNFNDTA
jgi:hypothetical protein